jgi:hypothetical protein
MPTVRRLERQVSPTALPGVRRRAAATFESEGGAAELARGRLEATREAGKAQTLEARAGFGEQVARLGVSLYARVQAEERDKANQTALLKASNALSDWKNQRLYDPNGGALTIRGENAMPLPEQIRDEFDKIAGDLEAGLGNDDQKAAFQRMRSQEWQGIDLQVRRHVFGEMQEFRAGELKSHVENSVQAAMQNALDPRMVRVELEKAVTAIRTNGPTLGLGPEMIEAQVRAVTSQTHVGVIGQLLAKENDKAASAYFEATKGQIEGTQLDNVMKALDEGTARSESQKAADEIIRAGGTLTQQREKARQIDDARLRDLVEQRIEHNAIVSEREEREAAEASMRQGYDVIDRTGDVTAIQPVQWASYSGATRSAMLSYARQKAAGTPIQTDLPTYYALMQQAADTPEIFTSQNLLNYRHKLDDVEFKQLAGLQLSIKNADRNATEKDLAPFRTKVQLVDDTLALHGIDPNAKPDTPQGKAIAQLRRMVDRRVELLQAGGKKATNTDIQSEIDSLLAQNVTVPGSWWNIFPGGKPFLNTEKRLLNLTAADIPTATREQIEQALRARNRPVSDAAVLDLYLETLVRSRR